VEGFTWISDVERGWGRWVTSLGIGRCGMWAHSPLSRPIASYAHLLSIFVIFHAYK